MLNFVKTNILVFCLNKETNWLVRITSSRINCSDFTAPRALQLLSTIMQSEFCIALLVLKYVFGYSVVLCKVKQKKSINLLEAVNIAQDIANELKCLREKTEYEFPHLYIFAQEMAKAEDFILKIPCPLEDRPIDAILLL